MSIESILCDMRIEATECGDLDMHADVCKLETGEWRDAMQEIVPVRATIAHMVRDCMEQLSRVRHERTEVNVHLQVVFQDTLGSSVWVVHTGGRTPGPGRWSSMYGVSTHLSSVDCREMMWDLWFRVWGQAMREPDRACAHGSVHGRPERTK